MNLDFKVVCTIENVHEPSSKGGVVPQKALPGSMILFC